MIAILYSIPAIIIGIWIVALFHYAQKNQLKEGFRQLGHCLRISILLALLTVLISMITAQILDSRTPTEGSAAGYVIVLIVRAGGGVLVGLTVLVLGLKAYSKANKIQYLNKQHSNSDILDDLP